MHTTQKWSWWCPVRTWASSWPRLSLPIQACPDCPSGQQGEISELSNLWWVAAWGPPSKADRWSGSRMFWSYRPLLSLFVARLLETMFSGLKGLFRHEPRTRRRMTPSVLAKPQDHAFTSVVSLKALAQANLRLPNGLYHKCEFCERLQGRQIRLCAAPDWCCAAPTGDATWIEEAYG